MSAAAAAAAAAGATAAASASASAAASASASASAAATAAAATATASAAAKREHRPQAHTEEKPWQLLAARRELVAVAEEPAQLGASSAIERRPRVFSRPLKDVDVDLRGERVLNAVRRRQFPGPHNSPAHLEGKEALDLR